MRRSGVVFGVLGMVLVTALWWMFVISPTNTKISDAQEEQQSAEDNEVLLRTQLSRLKKIQENELTYRSAIGALEAAIPPTPQMPALIDTLAELAEAVGHHELHEQPIRAALHVRGSDVPAEEPERSLLAIVPEQLEDTPVPDERALEHLHFDHRLRSRALALLVPAADARQLPLDDTGPEDDGDHSELVHVVDCIGVAVCRKEEEVGRDAQAEQEVHPAKGRVPCFHVDGGYTRCSWTDPRELTVIDGTRAPLGRAGQRTSDAVGASPRKE